MLDTLTNESPEERPERGLMRESLNQEIKTNFAILTEREIKVITFYYGLHGNVALTLEEIGERLNLTRERVRQIKEKAIRTLRNSKDITKLKTYLGQE